MTITQRQSVILTFGVMLAGTFIIGCLLLFDQIWQLFWISLGACLAVSLLLAAYIRGWEYARHTLVILITLVNGFGSPDVALVYSPTIFLPPALALVAMGPRWVFGSAMATAIIFAARAGGVGPNADISNLVIYIMVVGAMILAQMVISSSQRRAHEAQERAEAAQMRAEQQATDLAKANVAQQEQLDQQQRLLDLVTSLETPAVTLADGVLFAPVVGHLDSRRSAMLTTRLLEAAHGGRARHVILDISGVATVDTAVAKTLIDTARALKLLGCRVTLSGISSEVAITLTHQGVGLTDVTTVRSPQEALARL